MFQDKKRLYGICFSFFVIALLVAFAFGTSGRNYFLALSLSVLAAVSASVLKKRSAYAIEKQQVAFLMALMAALAIMLYYLSGLSLGFYKVLILPSFYTKYVLCYAVAIVAMELLRFLLLAQQDTKAAYLSYFICLVLDVLILSGSNSFSSFGLFMHSVGTAVFPALTSNLLYHNISRKYGAEPNILYKLLLVLYPYIIPYAVQMPEIMLSFAKTLLPVLVLVLLHAMYTPQKFVRSRKNILLQRASSAALLLVMACLIMLISCQFRFGLLVVGSESMSGQIDKGDAIVYEQYEGDFLQQGEVIVFVKDKTTIIHRIVDIQNIDGQIRYYTKGDANESQDSGYVTASQIIGTVHLKLKYIGYPTIWCRSLFS